MDRTVAFVLAVVKEFERAKQFIRNKWPLAEKLGLGLEVENQKVKFVFSDSKTTLKVEVPIPYQSEEGVWLINDNETIRPICTYFIKEDFRRVGFLGFMLFLLTDDLRKIKVDYPSKTPFLHRIIYSFAQENPAWVTSLCQRTINDFIHKLPLHETVMNSWAVNQRVEFLDTEFEAIRDPNIKLEYQVEKNIDFFKTFGWSSMGLSESTLSDANYLLSLDLKKTVPFGTRHHNPQRNLYQTLGMKGDEEPLVTTKTAEELARKGIKRGGKMMFTAFVDIPLVFEDQILGDKSLTNLMSFHERRYQCFGEVRVEKGQQLKKGDVIAVNSDGEPITFHVPADVATVTGVIPRTVNVGGEEEKAFLVKVKVGRFLKDGTKFTNLHGNKGVTHFDELGFAVDPRTGEKRKIDILVSAHSVKRRKNFGQTLEALTTLIHGKEKKFVLPDDFETSVPEIKKALKEVGLPEDGMLEIHTKWGKFKAICGWVFWGVIKDPEDQLWEGQDTWIKDGRGRRRAGLKFSNIEIRSLITQFGPNNAVVREILSYYQGTEDLRQMLMVLNSCRCILPEDAPTIDAMSIPPVDTRRSLLKSMPELAGTLGDETFMPNGFVLKLPLTLFMIVPSNPIEPSRWYSSSIFMNVLPDDKVFEIDKLFIPYFNLRRSWRHGCGRFGLSRIGNLANRIIVACHGKASGEADDMDIMRTVALYIKTVSRSMSTKTGELAQFGMAIRYPHSSKAVAALGEGLPPNTVEIHRDMANDLKVRDGDVVLAERFPCLGFMSVRPQKVKVTDDPACKYVIRVSGNSLVSMNLDFDGDTLYLMSFHTPEAKITLQWYFNNPNPVCDSIIAEMNSKKVPQFKETTLDEYQIKRFDDLTDEEHATIIRKAVGVKAHTGPVIALAYNLMRIVETEVGYHNTEINAQVEKLLDFLGNTVFSQKHGIESLQEEATRAVCLADVERMVELGFDRVPSELICGILRAKAEKFGITDLEEHYRRHKEEGRSNLINLIVRRQNKIYFASRANLDPYRFLQHLESKPIDLPSHLLFKALQTSKSEAEQKMLEFREAMAKLRDGNKQREEEIRRERFEQVWLKIQERVRGLSIQSDQLNVVSTGEMWPTINNKQIEVPFAK